MKICFSRFNISWMLLSLQSCLVRHLRQLKIYKGENKKYLKILISILGMLPIHYNGDIE